MKWPLHLLFANKYTRHLNRLVRMCFPDLFIIFYLYIHYLAWDSWILLRHNHIQLLWTTSELSKYILTSSSLPNSDDTDWLFKKTKICPGQCGSVSWSVVIPWTERPRLWFQVRAHAWLQIQSWSGCVQEAANQCYFLISMFFSLHSPLSGISGHIFWWGLKNNNF